jgi:hypothetical protein
MPTAATARKTTARKPPSRTLPPIGPRRAAILRHIAAREGGPGPTWREIARELQHPLKKVRGLMRCLHALGLITWVEDRPRTTHLTQLGRAVVPLLPAEPAPGAVDGAVRA